VTEPSPREDAIEETTEEVRERGVIGRLKGRGGRGQQRGGAVVPGAPGTRTIPATQMTAPTGYPVAPYLVTEESIREALQQQM